MFSSQSDNCSPFVHTFDIIFLFDAELEEPLIDIWGKGLIYFAEGVKEDQPYVQSDLALHSPLFHH